MKDGPGPPLPTSADTACAVAARDVRAVFLHTGWRTAGTWIWSRFRAHRDVTAYYEPLHERLGTLRHRDVSTLDTAGWHSGHPVLDRPYFDEFMPLIASWSGGVRLFKKEFVHDCFFSDPQAGLEMAAYLRMLISHAEAQRHVAILKFCRSLGRARWMMQQFPRAVHIAVVASPDLQWSSARRQLLRYGNPYFVERPFATLLHNRDQPQVARILARLKVRLPAAPDAVAAHVGAIDAEACYRGLMAFWLLCMLSVPHEIDAIVNAGLLQISSPYRRSMQQLLAELTGVPVTLPARRMTGGAQPDVDWIGLTPRLRLACHHDAQQVLMHDIDRDTTHPRDIERIAAMLAADDSNMLARSPSAEIRVGSEAAGLHLALSEEFAARAAAEQRSARLAAQLAALQASTSWAVTAPLRRLGEGLRTVSSRWAQ